MCKYHHIPVNFVSQNHSNYLSNNLRYLENQHVAYATSEMKSRYIDTLKNITCLTRDEPLQL